jgi:hypothetical protein
MNVLRWYWREFPALVVVVVGMIALMSYVQYGTSTTHTRCVVRGYPSYYVTWTLDRYCIKRVGQSDVVVPLDSLERAK